MGSPQNAIIGLLRGASNKISILRTILVTKASLDQTKDQAHAKLETYFKQDIRKLFKGNGKYEEFTGVISDIFLEYCELIDFYYGEAQKDFDKVLEKLRSKIIQPAPESVQKVDKPNEVVQVTMDKNRKEEQQKSFLLLMSRIVILRLDLDKDSTPDDSFLIDSVQAVMSQINTASVNREQAKAFLAYILEEFKDSLPDGEDIPF